MPCRTPVLGALLILLALSSQALGLTRSDSSTYLKLNRVIVIGNEKTLDRIITRELSMQTGDSVRRTALDSVLQWDKNRIYNLRIFNSVKIHALELPGGHFDLLVEVAERWYTFPVPIFQLSDRNFNDWWQNYGHKLNRVNYGVKLYQYNFRGRNELIKLTAQFGFSRRLDFTYRIPYVNKKQTHGLTFLASFAEPKNLAYQTTDHRLDFLSTRETLRTRYYGGVVHTFRKNFFETHNLSVEYEHGTIADTIRKLNDNYYKSRSFLRFGTLTYWFNSDHRDVLAYPLKGYAFTVSIKKIGVLPSDHLNQWAASLSYAWHKPLPRNFFFSNYTLGYSVTPSNLPYAQYYALGYGLQFVRGYEVRLIEGPGILLNKTTLKKRLYNRVLNLRFLPWEKFNKLPIALYLKAYTDFGYVVNFPYYKERNLNTSLSNTLLSGHGLGLDLVTAYDSVIRFEYSYSNDGRWGFYLNINKEF